jgi:hypothetical protein
MTKRNGENDGKKRQKRQFAETKLMESLNEINGIVQQNQWNRSTKSMDLFRKTGNFAEVIWRFQRLISTI